MEPPWPSGRVYEFGGSGPGFSIYLCLVVSLSMALSVSPKVLVTENAMVPWRHELAKLYIYIVKHDACVYDFEVELVPVCVCTETDSSPIES